MGAIQGPTNSAIHQVSDSDCFLQGLLVGFLVLLLLNAYKLHTLYMKNSKKPILKKK